MSNMKPEDRELLVRKLRQLASLLEAGWSPELYAYRPDEGYTAVYGVEEARKLARPLFADDPELTRYQWGIVVPVEVARIDIVWVENEEVVAQVCGLVDEYTYRGPVTAPR